MNDQRESIGEIYEYINKKLKSNSYRKRKIEDELYHNKVFKICHYINEYSLQDVLNEIETFDEDNNTRFVIDMLLCKIFYKNTSEIMMNKYIERFIRELLNYRNIKYIIKINE